ncbi:transcription factor ILI1-like [Lolium rigidum]|uniref:transcription factor ILI1-like n=1 Tax=Lolium rigidum TaxID=89674 RepID=UPI001F5D74C5|nr:transcription factor ILI1-like [Lolium rigidum]
MSSSSRRSRSRRAGTSVSSSSSRSISEDQISDLLSKLEALLPDSQARNGAHRGPASRVLQETCSYIRSLHREVDDLSETLAALLASDAVTAEQAAVIRSLLM